MANLLDAPVTNDDRMAVLGLLGGSLVRGDFGGGLLSANNYLNEAPDRRMKQALMQAQMQNFASEAEMRKLQADQARWKMGLINGAMGGLGGASSPSQPAIAPSAGGALGSGTFGIPMGGQPAVQPGAQGSDWLARLTPGQLGALKTAGIDLFNEYKLAKEGIPMQGGTWRLDPTTNRREYIPDVKTGFTVGDDGTVGMLPNFAQTNAAIKGAETLATQRATASVKPLDLKYVDRNTGLPIGGSELDYVDRTPIQQPDGTSLSPDLSQAIRRDAANNSIVNPNVNLTGAKPGQVYARSNVGAPTSAELQSAPEAAAAEAASVGKVKQTQAQSNDLAGETASYNNTINGLDRLSNAAAELAKHPGLAGIYGVRGAFPNVPGSDAADAQALLDTLKSQVGFSVLQDMRNNSKTGGALGQVSDRENSMLQASLAALDKAQSLEQAQRSLQNIANYAAGAQGRISTAFKLQQRNNPEFTPPPAPKPAPNIGTSNWSIKRVK